MTILRRALTVTLAGVLVAGFTSAQEKRIKRSDLPPAVEKSVADVSKGATIKGFNQETENGKMAYEVEMTVNGHSKDVLIDPSGTVLEIEEEVAMDSLSAGVKAGLTEKASGGKIVKIESLTKGGKLVAYEAQVQFSGKKKEIQVGPDGKPLDHEE